MKLDYSWRSLFKPGDAINYFNLSNPVPFLANTHNFNIFNAWWLAEISRLIYHNNFFNDENIQLGCFNFEIIGYIENKNTSTHVAILKVIQDKPCLVIVFRGTDEVDDWNINLHAYQSSFDSRGKVHSGFKKAYLSIKDELHEYLNQCSLPLFITGHSLGAALATLATSELQSNENLDSCYTFGSPRTGNKVFVDSIKCKQIYRVVNNCDVVTTVPINFAGIEYKHIGSPYLIDDKGVLLEGMSEDEIYSYQKSKLEDLKEYALSKVFNNEIKSIKDDLPHFLASHSPINYVAILQNLMQA